VKVAALDATGNTVTGFTGSVTLAIGTNPSGGTLTGGGPVAAVSGVATFSAVKIDKPGTGYTLTATSGTLTGGPSSAFNITAPPPPPNQTPSVNAGGDQSVFLGVVYSLNASFTDPDNGPWHWTVSWGDGTSTSGNASIPGSISPTHTYILGTFTITVTVTDSRGAVGSDSKTLRVLTGL